MKMIRTQRCASICAVIILYLLVGIKSYAQGAGFGNVAGHMLGTVNFASDFIYTACVILGCSFIFASIIKYVEHRNNPLMVTMSTVVFLFIAGFLLLLLPLLSYIYPEAIPYSFFH